MNKPIAPSELILNPDGSIYHLNLLPEHIADTILLVGDQDRVPKVSKYFDRIDFKTQKREFATHTGWLGKQRLTVVSTGIGTDNIDIVLNELDALVNIDLKTRLVKKERTSLNFIRIGTSGALHEHFGVDSFLVSAYGLGLDCLLAYYFFEKNKKEEALENSFFEFSKKYKLPLKAPAAAASTQLVEKMGKGLAKGITLSSPGFYAPQGRVLRLKSRISNSFLDEVGNFEFDGLNVTNFEMETSGILGLARMLGHQAVSCNAIIANRIRNEFSKDPKTVVRKLIETVLERVGEQ